MKLAPARNCAGACFKDLSRLQRSAYVCEQESCVFSHVLIKCRRLESLYSGGNKFSFFCFYMYENAGGPRPQFSRICKLLLPYDMEIRIKKGCLKQTSFLTVFICDVQKSTIIHVIIIARLHYNAISILFRFVPVLFR